MYQQIEQPKPIVKATGYGGTDGRFEISGLTKDEIESMQAMLSGGAFVRVNDAGRLERIERFTPLPDPCEDPKLGSHWQIQSEAEAKVGLTIGADKNEMEDTIHRS